MEKIASFTIDHIKLQPGIYVSRKDRVGAETITTFDLRMTSPNEEPVMNTAEVHTIEHLAATFLRNHLLYKEKTIYFGPMGCRTGFYLLLAGDLTSKDIVPLMIEMYEFIRDYKGEVPGASPKDCGNYLDMNLPIVGGKELLEYVSTEKKNVIPVVLSGYTDFEYVKCALANHAMDYLVKPLKSSELKLLLDKIEEKFRKQQFEEKAQKLEDAVNGLEMSVKCEKTQDSYQSYCMLLLTFGSSYGYFGEN